MGELLLGELLVGELLVGLELVGELLVGTLLVGALLVGELVMEGLGAGAQVLEQERKTASFPLPSYKKNRGTREIKCASHKTMRVFVSLRS